MIPYIPQPVFHIGPLTIHAFGITAAAAIITGYWLTLGRARALGLNERFAAVLYAAIALAGLTAGFAVRRLFAAGNVPGSGISSAGLAAGACLAAWILLAKSPDRWRYFDVFAFAFPFSLTIARAGCFLAHDHIGAPTGNWLGVRFPGGTRFDLGLLHCLATLIITIVVVLLSRVVKTPGLLFCVAAALIGASRLVVLQSADPLGVALTLGGLVLATRRSSVARIGSGNASDLPYPLERTGRRRPSG